MAAYEYFAATDTNTFIEHIKTKAEAYGWTIDYYASGRLHLHNADGAHFEIWYATTTLANIAACSGYSAGSGSTSQPGISSTMQVHSSVGHFIIICPHSICIKIFYDGTRVRNLQFGMITDKVGSWTGGAFISGYYAGSSSSYTFWPYDTYGDNDVQVFINGAWCALSTAGSPSVFGVCDDELYAKMPFGYSAGILPIPILLVRIDPSTTSYRAPIGYAPDLRRFVGGTVYTQLQEIMIDGETWIGINQGEANSTFASAPNLLIRLAEAV